MTRTLPTSILNGMCARVLPSASFSDVTLMVTSEIFTSFNRVPSGKIALI